MIQVNVGDVLSTVDARFGTGQKGPWGFLKVKAEKGYDTITVWLSNPDDAKGRTSVKIAEILNVKMSNRKRDEKWYTDYSLTARVIPASAQQQPAQQKPNFDSYMQESGFMEMDVEDSGLPFA